MEGDALAAILSPWSYKSKFLTPKPKACAPPSLQKVTILAKAINRNKPSYPAAYCPPGRCLVVCHESEGVAPGYSW